MEGQKEGSRVWDSRPKGSPGRVYEDSVDCEGWRSYQIGVFLGGNTSIVGWTVSSKYSGRWPVNHILFYFCWYQYFYPTKNYTPPPSELWFKMAWRRALRTNALRQQWVAYFLVYSFSYFWTSWLLSGVPYLWKPNLLWGFGSRRWDLIFFFVSHF